MNNTLDFKNAINLAQEANNWTQLVLNIIYPTIAGILLAAILIPAIIYFTQKIFGVTAEPSGLLKNWVSIFGSIIVVVVCYGIVTSVNLLMIKPQIEQLQDGANLAPEDFKTAITTSGFVIANIVFSAIIGLAQVSFAITYIIWLAKKSAGDATSAAALFKTLIINVFILAILVIVFFIINIAYDQYLAKTLEEIIKSV